MVAWTREFAVSYLLKNHRYTAGLEVSCPLLTAGLDGCEPSPPQSVLSQTESRTERKPATTLAWQFHWRTEDCNMVLSAMIYQGRNTGYSAATQGEV